MFFLKSYLVILEDFVIFLHKVFAFDVLLLSSSFILRLDTSGNKNLSVGEFILQRLSSFLISKDTTVYNCCIWPKCYTNTSFSFSVLVEYMLTGQNITLKFSSLVRQLLSHLLSLNEVTVVVVLVNQTTKLRVCN